MGSFMDYRSILIPIMVIFLVGCTNAASKTVAPTIVNTEPLPTNTPKINSPLQESTLTPEQFNYEFPANISPNKRYLFYLHGKIIEDQGIPAISPDYGEYEYEAILDKLANYGFIVISEQRPENADVLKYGQETAEYINRLLEANVPPDHITVVGASKGAYIAVTTSSIMKNSDLNFVLLGSCHPDTIAEWNQHGWSLYGNVLAIYESSDEENSGSCADYFTSLEGKGIAQHDEILLHTGMGHGFLYKPLDEWIAPVVSWASQ
jgi:hypothetical protein